MKLKNSLQIFLSYAVGAVLLGALVIARFPVYATAWFVFYIVAGIFQGKNKHYDLGFHLANAVIGLVLLAFTGRALLAAVSLASAYAFFVLATSTKIEKMEIKESESKVQREQIKKIIKEVVAKKPELEVVSYKDEETEAKKPAKKPAQKKKPRKK